MLDQDDRQANRLGKWLKERFNVGGLVATQDAPVWQNDTPDDALTARLARLDADLKPDELSFSPALRYALAPAPQALRLLRQHEGAAPGALAVLCPENEAHLTRLASIAAAHGFRLATRTGDRTDLAALPVDLSQLDRVSVLSAREGRVRFQAGASWSDLSEAATACRLSAPDVLHDIYPTPADAVLAGFLPCERQESAAGIVTAYETVLPPAGTRWLERLWLFTGPLAAAQSFETFCRQRNPVFAQLITPPLLDLAALTSSYELPWRLNKTAPASGLRLVFQGPSLDVKCASFAASWPLESAWGRQWNRALPRFSQVTEALFAAGATLVSIQSETSWDALTRTGQGLGAALSSAAADWPSTMKITPLTGDVVTYAGGKLSLNSTVLAPRDYLAPFDQWQAIHEAGQRNLDRSVASDAALSDTQAEFSEESPEWQAIRNALLDENGSLRPLQPEAAHPDDERRHG
ncbi:MAG: FAD-dependent oxidoreductase [Aquisalinus sp.]|nr:FAD-dependent oxidoreductase [Aquisalinus sp.]